MRMALHGNTLLIKDAGAQFNEIKSWGLMRWDKRLQALNGVVSLELLDKLAVMVELPSRVSARWEKLRAIQDAVDRERTNTEPKPLFRYPVKPSLYAHQVRASNMALLTFGWVVPKGGDLMTSQSNRITGRGYGLLFEKLYQ